MSGQRSRRLGAQAQEIHQEGLIIPPVKLYEGGKVNAALVKMFRANVRLPEQIAAISPPWPMSSR